MLHSNMSDANNEKENIYAWIRFVSVHLQMIGYEHVKGTFKFLSRMAVLRCNKHKFKCGVGSNSIFSVSLMFL